VKTIQFGHPVANPYDAATTPSRRYGIWFDPGEWTVGIQVNQGSVVIRPLPMVAFSVLLGPRYVRTEMPFVDPWAES
jgi:hypothetical protein